MTRAEPRPRMTWRTSSYCDTGQCVEVAQASATVLVRDTLSCGPGHLAFPAPAWAVFTAGIRNGGTPTAAWPLTSSVLAARRA